MVRASRTLAATRKRERFEMSDSDAIGVARLAHYRPPTPEEQEMINRQTMAEVIATRSYNPNAVGPAALVTPAGAAPVSNGVVLAPQPNEPGPGNNWGHVADAPKDLRKSDQDAIAALCDAHLGPAVPVEAKLGALSVSQLNDLLAEIKRRAQTHELITLSAMIEEALRKKA
jgi:hypothetical protein